MNGGPAVVNESAVIGGNVTTLIDIAPAHERARRETQRQRRLFISAGLFYGALSLWIGNRLNADPALGTISLGLLVAVLLIYALTFLRDVRTRTVLLPILTALVCQENQSDAENCVAAEPCRTKRE